MHADNRLHTFLLTGPGPINLRILVTMATLQNCSVALHQVNRGAKFPTTALLHHRDDPPNTFRAAYILATAPTPYDRTLGEINSYQCIPIESDDERIPTHQMPYDPNIPAPFTT